MRRPAGRGPLRGAALVLAVAACGGDGDTSGGSGGPEGEGVETSTAHNALTAEEAAEGWILLFDGESRDGWRGYGRDDTPESWIVEDGTLALEASGGAMDGGDIVTERTFTDFELVFDFRVGPEGNSGVFFRVREVEGAELWQVAPEYQVLDDPAYVAMGTMDMNTHLTGDNYDLHSAIVRPLNPTGEWNRGRIVVRGRHVEHWLNGERTVQYELYSDDWEARVARSKFAEEEHYARAASGPIALQDHGTPVWFRNLKIRPLDE